MCQTKYDQNSLLDYWDWLARRPRRRSIDQKARSDDHNILDISKQRRRNYQNYYFPNDENLIMTKIWWYEENPHDKTTSMEKRRSFRTTQKTGATPGDTWTKRPDQSTYQPDENWRQWWKFRLTQKTIATTDDMWKRRPDQPLDSRRTNDNHIHWKCTEDTALWDAKSKTIEVMT